MPDSDQAGPVSPAAPARSPATAPRSQALARRLLVPVVLVAVLVPYAITLLSLWSRTGAELDQLERERAGVVAVRPLVTLIAASADAQSAAVAGRPVDAAALRAAMAATDAADAQVGVMLAMDRRWADLRSRLAHLLSTAPTGAEAYGAYTQVIDLETALLTAVGDSSGLRVDSAVDSHYLMDAVLLRLPAILVAAGRIVDVTVLSGSGRASAAPDRPAAVVAEDDLRQGLAGLDDGLRKGFSSTSSRTLGPALLGELDRLRDAAALLAPPLASVGAAPTARTAAASETARRQVRAAAVETASASLLQLADLLDTRRGEVTGTRRTVAAATAAGTVAVLAVVWFAAPRRRSGDTDEVTSDSGLPAGEADPDLLEPDTSGLLEARELLQARQLIRVGRAVSARPTGTGPPPEEGR